MFLYNIFKKYLTQNHTSSLFQASQLIFTYLGTNYTPGSFVQNTQQKRPNQVHPKKNSFFVETLVYFYHINLVFFYITIKFRWGASERKN